MIPYSQIASEDITHKLRTNLSLLQSNIIKNKEH